jgi:phosphate uptake regulator
VEVRKLQQIKDGSFIISLPKRWVEKKKLKRGEGITIIEDDDGSLRLYPLAKGVEEPAEVKLTLEDFPDISDLEYCIKTYYVQGSSKISVVSKEIIPADFKKRLKILRMELPGLEVAEEEADRIDFQVIIDLSSFSLKSLIEKTSAFSLNLQRDAVKAITENNLQLAEEVIERSREALRHYRIIIRQTTLASFHRSIAKKVGVSDSRECVTFVLITRDLSRLIYHSFSMARHFRALNGKEKISPEIAGAIKELSNVVYNMQKDAVRSFLEKDVKLAISVMNRMNDVRSREEKLLTVILKKIRDVETAITLSHIVRDLRRIAGFSVAIADDAMNRALTPFKLHVTSD